MQAQRIRRQEFLLKNEAGQTVRSLSDEYGISETRIQAIIAKAREERASTT